MKFRRLPMLTAILGTSTIALSGLCIAMSPAQAPQIFGTAVKPVLTARCVKCHNPATAQGGLNLAQFGDERALVGQRRVLRRVAERIEAGDMPPVGQPQLTDPQKKAVLTWVRLTLKRADTVKDPGPSPIRRLTRFEYDRTIRDLIGIDFNSLEQIGLPDDPTGQGFDNSANALNIPPTLMDKFVTAADMILDRIIVGPDGRVPDGNWDRGQAQRAHDALFGKKASTESPTRESARRILESFVQRAYRRPLTPQDIDPLLAVFDRMRAKGLAFENALRIPLKAVLISPEFLYRLEADPVGVKPGEPGAADDFALATRLSYFLWSTMPDDTLFALAKEKKLSSPEVLTAQVKRMLSDPKADALTESFAAQWLQLRKFAEARPSQDVFPTFDDELRRAMIAEATMFFDRLRTDDKSVVDLLSCDYTYANEVLAKHYNLSGVTGKDLKLIQLSADSHRGGLLGMGAVLAMTSHTYRTSPTLRGKWILDVIFGTPPPPPPPGAGQIQDEEKKQKTGSTFRELLAQHASRPACAGCHQKIDPLGFAMENYDAIGRWRVSHAGAAVDTSAQLPSGEKLNGADDLKQIIFKRKDVFVRNMVEQMLSYALGRQLESTDETTVDKIFADLKQNDYRFSTLATGIVTSYPFRSRRGTLTESKPVKAAFRSTAENSKSAHKTIMSK